MSKIFQNLEIPIDNDLEEKLQWLMPEHGPYRILRQSVDARRSHSPHFVYTVEVAEKGEALSLPEFKMERLENPKEKPLIVGTGPAGLFAALRFVERGVPCVLFERGSDSGERIKGINQYWRYGKLDPRNNVCFGEGGAGLYSDGKLITRIKSPHIPYVMNRLVQFGAPEEIQWLSNPHVGSDRIRRVIPKLREFLRANGCEIHFNTQVTEVLLEGKQVVGVRTEHGTEFRSPHVVMATGHSAEDMINHLRDIGVKLDGKSFAMGLRVEHSQASINKIQYRQFSEHPKLGAANYKLAHHDNKSGIGVYSFCMCPGGYVLSSGTEADGIVCNGMSNYNRNSPFANAAIVVSIDHEKNFGDDVFGGMKMRRELETRAYQSVLKAGGTRELPAQNLLDFLYGTNSKTGPRPLRAGSSPSGALNIRLDELLPNNMRDRLREGFEKFQSSMKGFLVEDAQVYGVESRTSCPVRVTRDDETLESVSHKGLYPAGEGAGYAGGITSAACDGVRIAEKIIAQL
ncbi:FAD-dependent oxidoreductase [Bdellovibrio bacteriovorus]|uniref:NAD(P)/FAD-dependent oxidoreductase n=1 Tax=Bdellovibrio bacteriovorus TaxID=959 RepID=UPI0021D20E8B|nr:FAD-dependent oxidoreductase [Bdellovibrio bacteriovorus]UXR63661.1 FAD-dependent oxidoreductase [Bdellovibrio bacteriovorus]